jgi:predicted DNA-binding ribbon-helix-helix protein
LSASARIDDNAGGTPALPDNAVNKRSVVIAGHATSVSLEPEFWVALTEIAQARGLSLNALVRAVDAERTPDRNLSSALRVFVLRAIRPATHAAAASGAPDGSG